MTSKGDRLQAIRKSSGEKQQKAIKAAFRDGISATKIAEAAKQERIGVIKKLANEGW